MHFRFAAHCLNLFAVTDLKKAINRVNNMFSKEYSQLSLNILGSLQTVWIRYKSYSKLSDEVTVKFCDKAGLVMSTQTGRNSLYDSIQRFLRLIEQDQASPFNIFFDAPTKAIQPQENSPGQKMQSFIGSSSSYYLVPPLSLIKNQVTANQIQEHVICLN
ncbi:unnamed protein product [Lepeophtheirus salmonis]|uniref:(salmon louse) hypothetical protein n=1 Tax=Lepeophtheirus salmonis TaxID=72036 RepID=A0A7R8H497_LEPSM|nr:unnamed protein product [Lepeophtheirus salmonis]CAF2855083.1 unnamed protein product [Lepeophtheirus salmonis]